MFKRFTDGLKKMTVDATDETALANMNLYPHFDSIKGTYQKKGVKCRYEVDGEMKLFKFLPENVTDAGTLIVENWMPTVQTVWEPIDETHAGTKADPIPAAAGMTYVYGKYYIEGETLYICKRRGEADGGKITLQHLPSALVGHYFEVV